MHAAQYMREKSGDMNLIDGEMLRLGCTKAVFNLTLSFSYGNKAYELIKKHV